MRNYSTSTVMCMGSFVRWHDLSPFFARKRMFLLHFLFSILSKKWT